jgi:hypothetical protein
MDKGRGKGGGVRNDLDQSYQGTCSSGARAFGCHGGKKYGCGWRWGYLDVYTHTCVRALRLLHPLQHVYYMARNVACGGHSKSLVANHNYITQCTILVPVNTHSTTEYIHGRRERCARRSARAPTRHAGTRTRAGRGRAGAGGRHGSMVFGVVAGRLGHSDRCRCAPCSSV